jgi:hypothetical protein
MRAVWVVLMLCMVSWCVQAQGQARDAGSIVQRLTPQQVAEIGLTPRQIELLDRYLGDADAEALVPGPALETARYEAESKAARDPASLLGLNDAPIKGRLQADVSGWEPGTVFALDNGQQWKVLKGRMRLRTPLVTPEVKLVPGIAGRWFLQLREDLPKARVYRID